MAIINRTRRLLILVVALSCPIGPIPIQAQVVDVEALQRKQEEQQRARALTRDLVAGILEIQLRQLEENGLSDQEIFRDIKMMREKLNQLVDTEMSQVIDLLSAAQRLPRDQREASFIEARQQIRTIVRQLAIERRNLHKRLKFAELAEQVQRLIRQQTTVQTTTRRLPQEQQARQEALTLKAIEDQRDVKELFLQLWDTMDEMKSWSGIVASTATDGLRILKAAEVGTHLDEASRSLQAVKYGTAFEEQDHALKGLLKLLNIIERTQGAMNSERNAAAERIRDLIEKQKQLRDETARLPDNQQPTAEMVNRQSQIENEITKLPELLRNDPKSEVLIKQAAAAASDAAADLLDSKREEAQANQVKVLTNLAALEFLIKEPIGEQSRDKSADELAELIQSLNQTKSLLTEAKQKQSEATESAKSNVQEAIPKSNAVAQLLSQANTGSAHPAAVEAALAEAQEAARQSSQMLESATEEKVTADQEQRLISTENAISRAIKAVDTALAESGRLEAAIKIGELARAAEVLERSAAEERVIAKDAEEIAHSDKSQSAVIAQHARDLADRQESMKSIATKTAEALSKTAPRAAQLALEGAQKVDNSRRELQDLVTEPARDLQVKAKQASENALSAAQRLSDSARQIRDEIVTSAKALAERSSGQADQLTKSRKAIEEVAEQFPSHDPITQLESAKEKLSEAMQEQAKAQGRPEAAASMRLADQIANALDSQDAASAAALAAEAGVGSELKTTALQEEVAEKSQAAAEAASRRNQTVANDTGKSDSLVQQLNNARQAASQAARQTLDGNPAAAQASRKTAEESLKRALGLAQLEALSAASSPATGQPDQAAQTKAAAAALNAQQLAAQASDQAGNDVAPAANAAEAANRALLAKSDQVARAQAKSAEALREAQKSLDAAILAAATGRAEELAKQASKSAALADQIARVDPSAGEAIQQAASAAKLGSQAGDSPRRMMASGKIAETSLESAAANLGAKEQEVSRDQAIAEAIANLTQDQQAAAAQIAERAADLERQVAQMREGDQATKQLQTAAQKLKNAQQQFADAQRATGQGAVELSGQTQVANRPLREALELASDLLKKESLLDQPGQELPSDRQMSSALNNTNRKQPRESNQDPGKEPIDVNMSDKLAGDPSSRTKSASSAADKPDGLGTGFVSPSPELTAEMMAGPKAQNEARKILDQLPIEQGNSAGNNATSRKSSDLEDDSATSDERGTSSKLGQKSSTGSTNQKVKDGALNRTQEGSNSMKPAAEESREGDASIQARQSKDEAWFAKLPPELRKSIRTGAGQKSPRAYEERLKKYFQSVD